MHCNSRTFKHREHTVVLYNFDFDPVAVLSETSDERYAIHYRCNERPMPVRT